MLNINQYDAWPDGWHKKQAAFGPYSGTLVSQYLATSVISPAMLAAGTVYGVPYFLWKNGDGTTPMINPGVTLTATGVITNAGPTPWQYPDGSAVTGEVYSGASYRQTNAYAIAPADPVNDDMVIAVCATGPDAAPGADQCLLSTRLNSTGNGFNLVWQASNDRYTFRSSINTGGSGASSLRIGTIRGPVIIIAVVDRPTNAIRCFANGTCGSTIGTIIGNTLLGVGTSIGATMTPGQIIGAGSGIAWVSMWIGAGIGAAWSASSDQRILQLTSEALGMRETVSRKFWSFTQDSVPDARWSKQDRTGRWWLYEQQSIRAGDSTGLLLEPRRDGLTYKNYNLTATTGWSVTGGTLTSVNDAAALEAALAYVWGPNVLQFANTSGADQYLYGGTNATNAPHCMQVMARYTAGAGARLGWRDSSSAAFTDLGAVSDNYVRSIVQNSTPPDVDCKFCIKVPNNTTIRLMGMFLEPGVIATTPRGNPSTSAVAMDGRALATMADAPVDAGGSILTTLAPNGWSGVVPTDDNIITRATTDSLITVADATAPGAWQRSDGTVALSSGLPAAGVYVDVWSAWKQALQYLQTGTLATRVTGAYDGTIGGSGNLRATARYAGFLVKSVEIRSV